MQKPTVHSSTKRKHMHVSCTKGQANDEHSLICSRKPCQVSLQLSSCDIAVVLSSILNLKYPDDTAPFSSLGPALLQMIKARIMASSRGKRATHIITTTLLNSTGAGASIAVTPGSVDGPRSTLKRETECYYVRHSR